MAKRTRGQAESVRDYVEQLSKEPWFRGVRLTLFNNHYGIKLWVRPGYMAHAQEAIMKLKVAAKIIQVEESPPWAENRSHTYRAPVYR